MSAFYGTNFACVKILNDAMDPSLAAFIRFAIAASVFSPNLLRIIKTNPSLVKGGLEVGAYSSLGYWAQSNALESTSASIVAFICSLAVIVVPLLDRFVDKKKGEGMWYSDFIAPVLATIGVACLELGGADLPGVGSLWAFAQPLFFGLGFWRIEKIIKQAKEAGEAQGFTGAMMLTVAAFTFVWTLSSFFSPLLHGDAAAATSAVASQLQSLTSWKVICSLLWTGVVTTALTSFGENIAMKELSAAESTVIYSTEPLWGTAFAALTLGEHIGANTIVGAVLVISACVWSSMGPSLAALVLASQETWLASFAEVAENLATNWDELLRRLSGFGG